MVAWVADKSFKSDHGYNVFYKTKMNTEWPFEDLPWFDTEKAWISTTPPLPAFMIVSLITDDK